MSAIGMLVGLVVTPFLISQLGSERYGAFRAASEWLSHVRLLEFGLAGAIGPLLVAALARNDDQTVRHVLITSVRAYGRVALGMVVAALALGAAMPRLVPVAPSLERDLQLGCAVAALGILVCPLLPAQSLVEAEQRGYVNQALLLAQALTSAALAVVLATLNMGITGQFLAIAVGTSLSPVILAVRAAWRHPGLVRGLFAAPVDEVTRAHIRHLSGPTFLFQLCGRVSFVTDQSIVGLMLGPAAVVPLFCTQRLSTLALMQLQGVGNASWAPLADLHARGEVGLFNERLVELTRVTAVLGACALAPIVLLNEAFVSQWVGAERFAGMALTLVASLNAQLHAVQSLWSWALTGTSRVRLLIPVWGVAAVINLAASVALTAWVGVVGPLLGTLVAFATWSLWSLLACLSREFGASVLRLLIAALAPTVVGAGVAAFRWVWWPVPAVLGWPRLLGEMAATGALTLLVCWILTVPEAERRRWRGRLMALVARIRGRGAEAS